MSRSRGHDSDNRPRSNDARSLRPKVFANSNLLSRLIDRGATMPGNELRASAMLREAEMHARQPERPVQEEE